MNVRIILAIARKDIMDALRNSYVVFILIMPLGLSLFFNMTTPDSGQDARLNIVIYDEGQSRLVELLEANRAVKLIRATSAADVQAQVKDGELVGVALPAGFDDAVQAGETPELSVYYSGRRRISGQQEAALREILDDALRGVAGQARPAVLVPVDVLASEEESAGPAASLDHFYLVLLLVMSLGIAGIFVVPTLLVEEKEKRTLQAILVSPASTLDVVAGKALVGLFYSLLLAILILVLNDGLVGNVVVTVLAVVLGALVLVLVGLLMGAALNGSTQVNIWSSIVLFALLVPTIFLMPPQPPAPVSTIVRLLPTSHMALPVLRSLGNSATLGNVGPSLLALGGMAAIAAAVVVWLLRRERV
jgi:ABC-2 type transport system permease protein